jgi:HK97 gp10 family phage protein
MSSLEGIGDCIKSLDSIGKQIMNEVDNILAQSAGEMEAIAKTDVPEDTGVLASSISSKLEVHNEGYVRYVVESDTEYAIHVEYGTDNMEAQPFLRPALDKVRGELKLDLKSLN